ncbi:hypothetical protein [Micromonospora coxensis]|uniref:Uncharacterized protein n=1 Tax=Micromonospora coxensis TaxID=356852 RepID=A0A1C5JSJ3_9ACTN|nr:hypothetical protein [Micromonospora coxensis]SCG73560.1 hypothetical protein GA0070614_5246 [Micromonospora coxensis]
MTEPGRRRARLAAVLVLLVPLAACGQQPVAPLPVLPPTAAATGPATPVTASASGPETPATLAATRRPPAPVRPGPTGRGTPTPSPTPRPSACLGPVRYDLVLADTELSQFRSLCLTVGGVLRIQGIGPGEVTVDREELVSQHYEAGVVDIRFVRAGTVAVRIPRDGVPHTVTVVAVPA